MADEEKPGETPTPVEAETTKTEDRTVEQLQQDLAEAKKHIKELNRESTDRRKKLEALEKTESERKAAELSETDKLKAQVEQATKDREQALAKANERVIRSEVIAKAAALNFNDPTDAFALVDKSKFKVDEESGEVEGVEDALKMLAKAKPYMLKNKTPTLGPTNPGGQNGQGETVEQKRQRLGLR